MACKWPHCKQGGYWQLATLFLTLTLLFLVIRHWTRATANKIRPMVPIAFSCGAIPVLSHLHYSSYLGGLVERSTRAWLASKLVWTNNFSVKYGNFYYNPFHMVSIFGLLGSTVLLAMHGGDYSGYAKYNAHRELDEIEDSDEGTQRAMLLWRWVMGFNATASHHSPVGAGFCDAVSNCRCNWHIDQRDCRAKLVLVGLAGHRLCRGMAAGAAVP